MGAVGLTEWLEESREVLEMGLRPASGGPSERPVLYTVLA